jgi:hypothetical protein
VDIVDFGGMGFVIGAQGALIACVKSDEEFSMMMVRQKIYYSI